jgi:hypothetical protein
MHSFKDATGREWPLRITIGAAERLKESELKADLLALEVGDPPLSTRLSLDHPFRFHAIFILLELEAQRLAVDDQAFCEALDPPAIAAATNAFWEELLDFFRALDRLDLVKLVEAGKNVIEATVTHNVKQVERNLPGAIEMMLSQMNTRPPTFGSTSGSLPESSDSTPDRLLSASSIGP